MAPFNAGDLIPDGTYPYFDEQDQLRSMLIQSLADSTYPYFDEQDQLQSMLIQSLADGTYPYYDEQDQLQSMLIQSLADGKKIVSLANGKKIVLFGSDPGATCSTKHEPGFVEKADELKSNGISEILCSRVDGHGGMVWTPPVASVETTPPMMPSSLSSTHPAHYANNYPPPMFTPHPYDPNNYPPPMFPTHPYNHQGPPQQALVMPTYPYLYPPYPYNHPGNTQNTGNGKKQGTGKKILKTLGRFAVPLTLAALSTLTGDAPPSFLSDEDESDDN